MICLQRIARESWPLAASFRISRGAKSRADVVMVTLTDGIAIGRGEATPYARYGESPDKVMRDIRHACARLPSDNALARRTLLSRLPAGAARNALDCALWDLAAKRTRHLAWQLAGLDRPRPALTCYTLSLAAPEAMAEAARRSSDLPLLKLKLGADGDAERMRAVRKARPDARLVVDANEGWAPANVETLDRVAAECGVELIEQPLPRSLDHLLRDLDLQVPVCADESAEPGRPLGELVGRYDAVNIKLDKTGGLTHALSLIQEARRLKLKIMLGSMVATSLAMAPAMLLARNSDWTDLDSPLLLAQDRTAGISIVNGVIAPPSRRLWG
jgi:L-Ala-D/L-Glu epimerase